MAGPAAGTASSAPVAGEVAVGCLIAYQRERDSHTGLALVQGRHGKRGWSTVTARSAFGALSFSLHGARYAFLCLFTLCQVLHHLGKLASSAFLCQTKMRIVCIAQGPAAATNTAAGGHGAARRAIHAG